VLKFHPIRAGRGISFDRINRINRIGMWCEVGEWSLVDERWLGVSMSEAVPNGKALLLAPVSIATAIPIPRPKPRGECHDGARVALASERLPVEPDLRNGSMLGADC